MAENYQGINVSSGMGQGLAQVFDAYTPQYDLGEIGMVQYKNRMAQEEAARKKQEKLNKITANVKAPMMFPDYLKAYQAKAAEVLDFTKKGDEDGALKAKSELDAIGNIGKSIYDNAKGISNTVLQQPAGSFEGVDILDELTKGGRNINATNIYDFGTEDTNRLFGIKRKEKPFDYVQEMNLLQNVVPVQQDQRRTYRDEAMAKDGILRAVQFDPQWNTYAKAEFGKATPQEQAKYNGDYAAWAADKYYKDLLLEKNTPEPKGMNVSVNVGGGNDQANPATASFSEQEIPLGMKAANDEFPSTFKTGVIQLPSSGVELGGGLVSTDMYKITNKGETEQLKGQTAPTLKYSQIVSLPIATKDVEVTDTNGKKFIIKKGQVVQPNYKLAAKAINKADIPTENKIMAVATDEDGSTYYRPAADVAKAIVTTFSGQKGLTYKGQSVFNDIGQFADFLNSIGVTVQGYDASAPKQQTTTTKSTGGAGRFNKK